MIQPDLSQLQALLGYDEALVQRFIGIFKSQTPELLVQLRQAVDHRHEENTVLAAHTLKSQCRYFGLFAIVALAEQIELEPAAVETTERLEALETQLQQVLAGM